MAVAALPHCATPGTRDAWRCVAGHIVIMQQPGSTMFLYADDRFVKFCAELEGPSLFESIRNRI